MRTEIRVRPATSADRAACLDMWTALHAELSGREPTHRLAPDALSRWENDLGWWLRSEHDAVLVAEHEGTGHEERVVGMITAHPHRPAPLYVDELRLWLDDLYVKPGARRCGVGIALLDAAEAFAAEIGAGAVEAGILAENGPMRALWARRGGRETAVTARREIR